MPGIERHRRPLSTWNPSQLSCMSLSESFCIDQQQSFLQIKKLPPVLFQVNCTSSSIEFTLLPKVYIFAAPKQRGLFYIHDIFTHKRIGMVGKLDSMAERWADLERDEVFFDIRDNIVYKCHNNIYVYKMDLIDDETNLERPSKRLRLKFHLKFPETPRPIKPDVPIFSQFGERRVMPSRKSKTKMKESYLYWVMKEVIRFECDCSWNSR